MTAPAPVASLSIPFDNSYARLPQHFYARLDPEPAKAPRPIKVNHALARDLGIDPAALESAEGVETLAGNRVPDGAEPIAQAYAGHQFGGWSPQLGDGRAILLGEVVDRHGQRRDIQLKGSGRTPFSRMGDGRAPLGPVLREYIVSEAMAALGVPTTRSLAAMATGQPVFREAALPGAVLTRVAASHLRVGTFQYFAARQDTEALRLLADHAVARHDPQAAEEAEPYRAVLDGVIQRQARLIATWMGLGFIHGVMNTDNMTISGETIDYGPCAFMDAYHPETVFSSIDQFGRYAYANQPRIAHWNLANLAQCLLPLLAEEQEQAVRIAQASVDRFPEIFQAEWLRVMRRKLGLREAREGDEALAQDLLDTMAAGRADFTLTFRGLGNGTAHQNFADPAGFDAWLPRWQARLAEEGADETMRKSDMDAANPAFIPRNHLVEAAIASGYRGDFAPFETLLAVLARPYEDQPGRERFATPPQPEEVVHQTFCGT
ncbi:MAG: YdiU family protein [Pseudomonadota bacterium]